MKKFLLTLSLCFAAFAAMAQKQYTEKIAVTLNERSFPEATSTLSVTTNDNGTCDFMLPNFLLPSPEPGADPMYVGTIDLKGVKMVKGEKADKISTDTNIEILPGNMDGVIPEQWIGPLLGPVPIKLDGELTDTDMSATIHIAMPGMDIVVTIGEPIAPAPALELTSLTISGMPFEALEAGKTAYTLPYVYNPGIVFKGTTNEGYTVSESIYNNTDKTHTINVIDPAKEDTISYVFSFTDAVEDAAAGNYEGSLSVVLTAQDDNSVPTALSNAGIRITKNANGTINLAIDDFAFGGMVVGDIFVSNVPMKDGKIEKTRRTILMTDFDEAGNKIDWSLGWMMGALPVEVSADLNTTDKRTSASIDIITAENPMLAMMFKGIHVDFVPFTIEGEIKENGFGGRQYYENLKVKGAVTKENCKFLQINNHYVDASNNNEEYNLPMSYLDLSEATVAADVTMSDIMTGAPEANNTLVYLPEGNTIEAANAIVGTNAKELALNDALTFVSPKAFTAEAVNYSREFVADSYATLFLPFGTEKFDGEAYKFVKADSEKLYFETAKQLEALTPYLVKPLSAKPFANAAAEVAVAANDTVVKVTNSGMTFAGVLTAAESLNAEGEKVFALNADNAFAPVNDKACAAFRAIMFGNSEAEVLTLVIDNKVTGIVDASLDFNRLVDVYNIEGKLVRSRVAAASALNGLGSGVYIINGKKVIK